MAAFLIAPVIYVETAVYDSTRLPDLADHDMQSWISPASVEA